MPSFCSFSGYTSTDKPFPNGNTGAIRRRICATTAKSACGMSRFLGSMPFRCKHIRVIQKCRCVPSQPYVPCDCAGTTIAYDCRSLRVRHINISTARRIILLACPFGNEVATQVSGLRGKMRKLPKHIVMKIIFVKRLARTFKHPRWPVI